ncbi:MAG: NUDIX domain-containing protein [Haloarculaceae archaeon]
MPERVSPVEFVARNGGAVVHRPPVEQDPEAFASAVDADGAWGVGTLVEHRGRVLLVREGDTWLLPGGLCEPDESHVEGAVRETYEETGLAVRVHDLAAVTVRTVARGDATAEFYFATFRATPAGTDVTPAADPGLPGEAVDEAAWHRSLPDATLHRDLLLRLRSGGRRSVRED